MTGSALGPGTCEVLCEPFRSGISFPQLSGTPTGEPEVGLRPRTPWREPLQCNHSPICGLTVGMGLACTVTLPLLPIFLWFLLYIFACRSFSGRFQFLKMVAL